jgi:Trypsin-like peptidase domain
VSIPPDGPNAPKLILSLHDHIDKQADEALALLGHAVRPLFLVTEKQVPEFWGTGVLLKVGPQFLLATAAHVFHDPGDEVASKTIPNVVVTFGSEKDVELSGRVHRTIPPPDMSYKSDLVDVALLELNNEDAAAIDNGRFLSVHELDVRDHLAPRRGYFHIGYPGTKQKPDYSASRVKVMRFPFIGWEVPEELYDQLGYNRDSNLAVKFDRTKVMMGGRIGTAPKPDGTSGGGWWRIDQSFGPISADGLPKLVAITSKHYPLNEKAILAVRVSRLVQLLALARPDLAAFLPDVSYLPRLERWATVSGPFAKL